MPAVLSVRGDDRLKAAVLAMKAADRDLKRKINQATVSTIGPVWASEVASRALSAVDQRVLGRGARVKAGNPPTALAASSTRALRGGLVPADSWAAYEFGQSRDRVTTYQRRSVKGQTHRVSRHTTRQLPARNRSGRVVYAAWQEVAPRTVSLWVQLIVRTYVDAVGKGAS